MSKRIALCQLNPEAGKSEKNFFTIDQTIKNYAEEKIKLFIFPEDFLNGVLRGREDILTAGKKFDFWINRLCEVAKRYKVDLIPGSLPLFEKGKLFNTTIYINSEGKIINQYSKTNLWLSEKDDYSVSPNSPKVFQSILGKTMQIICWDLMDHKLFEEAIKQEVEWIINVSLWYTNQSKDLERRRGKTKNKYRIPVRRSERLSSIIETRSTEYNLGIIFCNIGGIHKYIGQDGSHDEARSAGCTQAIAPLDGVRKIIGSIKEKILICDIPEVKDYIYDHEIFYGRREDIKTNYPYSLK